MQYRIFNQLKNYILILIGLFMFLGYVWIKFLRERVPKNIPFNLSFLGFILLLYICILYTYIIYCLVYKNYSNSQLLKKLINYMYIPLEALDQSIKLHPYIYPRYKHFITSFPNNFGYLFKEPYYFYYIFVILPRIILITTLFMDTFYFHYLSNIYKVLPLFMFILFNRYIKYSLKFEKEQIILEWELLFSHITTPYVQGIRPSEIEGHPDYQDPNDPDYDDDIPPTMYLPLNIYMDFQAKFIVYYKYNYNVMISTTDKYDTRYCAKYNITEKNLYKKEYYKIFSEEAKKDLKKIMEIPLLLEYYNYAHNYEPNIKRLRILIYVNYLLCWLYILILSYPTLPDNAIIDKIELISNSIILSTMFISVLYIIGTFGITYKMSQIISIMKEDMGTKEELDKVTWIYMGIIILIIFLLF